MSRRGCSRDGIAVALALGGAMLGFAYFNRPTARLFLGDVGSLPIGLLIGWLLVLLAGSGHLTAALLLPLYYLADATLTLLRRCRTASASGRRTAPTIISAPPTAAFPSPKSSRGSSLSISASAHSRS